MDQHLSMTDHVMLCVPHVTAIYTDCYQYVTT
ncbi:hypothetical protein NP493_171g03014 [Ridgeia piscesae]|uniref:Uncharacterized protein n=1 Tax=Ridgeia piscesae TaxID=27915 RepID=A0AAD9P357_RIDPI|nr:hypothetical protein NP493_171g03014 [Ridgeia piscesae]